MHYFESVDGITYLKSQHVKSKLTHLSLGKMAAIFADDSFKCIFMDEKNVYFHSNFPEVCS